MSQRVTIITVEYHLFLMSDLNESNPLIEYYHRYIGDPDRTVDIYAGFGSFFAGLGLAITGTVIFFYSATLPSTELSTFSIRQLAAVSSAIGLPLLLFGIVFLLPVDRRMLAVAGIGTAICGAATGLFVWAYPYHWNVVSTTDYSAHGVAVYSVGVVMVIAATGAALVAHRIEQAAPRTEQTDTDTPDEVTDEQVEKDIEQALDDSDISWGGVDRKETNRLNLNPTAFDNVPQENLPNSTTETRKKASTVDSAVNQLRGFQGGNMKTESGKPTTDQAAALQQLRKQQRDSEPQQQSVLDRLRNFL